MIIIGDTILHRLQQTIILSILIYFLAACSAITVQDDQSQFTSTNHIDHAEAQQSPESTSKQRGHQKHSEIQPDKGHLRVVTWNVEHLAYPIDSGCKPRTTEEVKALKQYATSLNADIVGLQEVGSAEAAHLLFPANEWRVIMSDRPDSESYECRDNGNVSSQQKVAFAVRKSIAVNRIDTIRGFGLNRPGLRYGLAITVDTPLGETTILNLHLKSGCFVDNYQRKDGEACELLGMQIPILQDWIKASESSGNPYLIIGDLNHRISAPYNRMTRDLRDTSTSLYIVTRDLIGCHPWYPAPIDHIIVGNTSHHAIKKSAQIFDFQDMTVENMLSDHCAVAVDL